MDTSTEMIPLADAGLELRLTYSKVYGAMLAGRLGQAERRGKRWYVSAAGVAEFLRANEYETTTRPF